MTTPPDPVAGIVGRLTALADMCEAATSPMRWLDGDIALHVFGNLTKAAGQMFCEIDGASGEVVPHFTESLEAALKLVPEGSAYTMRRQTAGALRWNYQAVTYDRTMGRRIGATEGCASQALAVCVAALRARAALTTPGEA